MKHIIPILVVAFASAPAIASDPLDICLITGYPSAEIKYEKIKYIKVGKGSYGSVTEVLPIFSDKAAALGANAVVNYVGSQRFGFWPWRFVRPVLRGEAAKIDFGGNKSCKDLGGASVREVIQTNKEPHLISMQMDQAI